MQNPIGLTGQVLYLVTVGSALIRYLQWQKQWGSELKWGCFMESLESRRLAAGFDFNSDGVVDLIDVDQLCLQVAYRSEDFSFDADGDGWVGLLDVNTVLESIGSKRGDLDLDGDTDSTDMLMAWQANSNLRRAANPSNDVGHRDAGMYSEGNFFCRDEGVIPLRANMFDVDRSVAAEAFVGMNGDYNVDGVFDSSDIVQLFATGDHTDVDTSELVQLFQQGHYVT